MFKKIIWWAVGIIVVLGLVWFFWPAKQAAATVVLPTCGTETYEFYNEGSNTRVSVNVHGFDQEVDVTGLNGWSVSNLWLDQVGGGTNYVSFGSGNKSNFNPPSFGNIDKTKVEVTKACPVNGGWSSLSCPTEPGSAAIELTSVCNNPVPSNGGADCVLPAPTLSCPAVDPLPVPVNGGWSTLSCPTTPGSAAVELTALCTNPAPANGGTDCVLPAPTLSCAAVPETPISDPVVVKVLTSGGQTGGSRHPYQLADGTWYCPTPLSKSADPMNHCPGKHVGDGEIGSSVTTDPTVLRLRLIDLLTQLVALLQKLQSMR